MSRADYEQALEAARCWIAEHRRYPQQQEWEHWAAGRPTTRTIKQRWGWDELMMAAAGDACGQGLKLQMLGILSTETIPRLQRS
jgi:hypothetical protein